MNEHAEEMAAYFRRIQTEIADNEAALADFWLESLKQSDSMLVSWMGTQQQLGDAWYQAAIGRRSPVQDPTAGRAEDILESWLDAASRAVHLQNEWLGLWASMMGCKADQDPTSRDENGVSGASQDAETHSPLSARRKSALAEEVA